MDLGRAGGIRARGALTAALWLGLGALLGCGGWAPRGPARAASATPAATPTLPPLVVVQRPPALEAWDARLSACAPAGPVLLAVEPAVAPQPTAGWALTWGPPPEAATAAYGLGREAWAVVVAAANPVPRIPAEAWGDLWRAADARWDALGGLEAAVVPVVPHPDGPLARALTAQVGPGWRIHPRARLAPTPAQTVQQVAAEAAALGLVPRGWVTWARQARPDLPWHRVRVLPAHAAPRWEADVVLWTTTSPPQAAQRWVQCIQDGQTNFLK